MMGYIEEQELNPSWVSCLLEDIPAVCYDETVTLWPSATGHPFISPKSLSKNSRDSCGTLDECCRKRVCGGTSRGSSSRACREKLRRDRVNERFSELSAVIEAGKTPKLDKAATLTDAVEMVKMLQQEITALKSQNVELIHNIYDLKAEKKELRSEKQRLKAEKDRIEQRMKALSVSHAMQLRRSVIPGPYAIHPRAVGAKLMPPVYNYPGCVPLWCFVPRNSVDTSQDHVLRPPVA